MRDAHNKMSKRHGDPSYEDLKAQGYLTPAIVNYVALLGWSPRGEREIYSLSELEQVFDTKGLSKSPAIFDIEKLRHFNAEYIRAMSPEAFAAEAEPWIREAVKNPAINPADIAALLQQRTEVMTEIPAKLGFFDALPEYGTELFVNKKSKSTLESSAKFLGLCRAALADCEWNDEAILNAMKGVAEAEGVKNAAVMWPERIAVSGTQVTPGGAVEITRILGREETLRRIDAALAKLG